MTVCFACGGAVIEYDAAAGNGFCLSCGTVVEENTIVSEVTFGETSAGAAMVQGSYVAQGSTRARMNGPYGNRGSNDSREQTIANANKKIQSIASYFRLSEIVCLAATRLYTLAVEHKFTKGRKSVNVVAVCLYVACRQKETRNYMLIDFSDLLQVNVFELGHTYLQLVQTLNLRLPLVDPSHYISRFSALLEFGDETHRVATDAVRLVQRFDRDWMTKGRRPAGICGAALFLAARMNNFRRSIEEIVQVVKIADTTLKKRLEEFRQTPSGQLTLADFRSVWLEEEMDPPAFSKGKEKEEEGLQEGGETKKKGKNAVGKKKRKRKEEEGEVDVEEEQRQPWDLPPPPRPGIDPALLNEGILAGTMESTPLFIPDVYDDPVQDPNNYNIDPILLPPAQPRTTSPRPRSKSPDIVQQPTTVVDETANAAIADEVTTFLQSSKGAALSGALDEAEQRRQAQISVVDELIGLDEEELDRFLLTDDEVKVKERVWVEMNKEYLENLAAKADRQESGATSTKSRKRRKTSNKTRESSEPASSTAESVRNLLKKNPTYSKRINYDALKDLFVEGADSAGKSGMDEKGDELYTLDDKSDGEGMFIIEEEGGGVGMAAGGPPERLGPDEDVLTDADAEADEIEFAEGSEKGDDPGGWEDAYEQEV